MRKFKLVFLIQDVTDPANKVEIREKSQIVIGVDEPPADAREDWNLRNETRTAGVLVAKVLERDISKVMGRTYTTHLKAGVEAIRADIAAMVERPVIDVEIGRPLGD